MAHTWDPDRYLTYADERGRPFVELSPGSTPTDPRDRRRPRLRPRQPHRAARRPLAGRAVAGARLQPRDDRAAARTRGAGDRLRGRRPARLGARRRAGVDVLVSNATLQWVPGHLDLLPAPGRPGRARAAGSRSRCPATSTSPATRSARELAAEPPYAEHTARRRRARQPRPGDLPRRARRPRLRGRRVGDDLPPRAAPARTRSSPGSPAPAPGPTLQALPDDLRRGLRGGVQAPAARRPTPTHGTAWCCRSAGSSSSRRCRAMRLHHVQVACPPGGEDDARRFYGDGLGMTEVEKPADLRGPGRRLVPRVRADGASPPRSTSASRTRSRRPARRTRRSCSTTSPSSRRRRAARRARLRGRLEPAAHVPRLRAVPHLRRPRQPGRACGLRPAACDSLRPGTRRGA